MASNQHPDLIRIGLIEESKQLRIDQVRGLAEELALPTDDAVPFEARAAVLISVDAAESLIRHYSGDDGGIWFGSLANAIAWDLRRLFGDEAGFDLYDTCRWVTDEDDDEEASRREWTSFQRERQPSDVLLIDLADDAIHQGWQAPAETSGSPMPGAGI